MLYLHREASDVSLEKVVAKSLTHCSTLFLCSGEHGDKEDIRGTSRSKPLQYRIWSSLMLATSTFLELPKQLSVLCRER